MSLITWLEKVLPFLFKAAKREWDSLPATEQNAILHGSGVLDILNTETGKLPAEVRAAITKKFPDLDEATLEKGLFELAHTFGLLPKENDLDDCITLLQTYLSSQQGVKWAAVIQSAANILAIIVAPAGTIFAKIGMLMEYAYQTFFKKK